MSRFSLSKPGVATDACRRDGVVHLVNRREDRVDRNRADRLILGLVALGGHVALARAHRDLEVDVCLGARASRSCDPGSRSRRSGRRRPDRRPGARPHPWCGRAGVFGPSECMRSRTSLRLRMMSDTSSITPGIVENSCRTPSMRIADDGRALQRGQQHAAQRVAERRAESALERLAREAPEGLAGAVAIGLEFARADELAPILGDEILIHEWSLPVVRGIAGRFGDDARIACRKRRSGSRRRASASRARRSAVPGSAW